MSKLTPPVALALWLWDRHGLDLDRLPYNVPVICNWSQHSESINPRSLYFCIVEWTKIKTDIFWVQWSMHLYFDMQVIQHVNNFQFIFFISTWSFLTRTTDAQRGNKLHCKAENSLPLPKFLDTDKAYFVCHIGPIFQISLIYAFIGCP